MESRSPINVFKAMINVEETLEALKPVLESGWIGLGPKTREFEIELEKFLNVKHISALNSCTSALHLALKVLNLPKGTKVLTTPITFTSTNSAILYDDLVPVFCDVEETTGNMKPEFVEHAILTEKIGAIIVVHIGGYSANMMDINYLAEKHNIPVIEDCAHSFGAKYNFKKVGDTNNICCWSFQAVKNLPVGDGGAISTNNSDFIKTINQLRWLGINKDTVSRSNLKSEKQTYNWDYSVDTIGYKYHMSDITACLGLVGLKTIEKNNARRKEIAEYYLKNVDCIKPDYSITRQSSFHFLPLFFENRDQIYKKLIDSNIFPGMHYKRNDLYPPFKDFQKINNCEHAEWYQNHELTLPIHLGLSDNDLEYIVKVVNG